MDIHKPKAAHNLREFLVEIWTIICGILIALGLEQAIEAWHWRSAVAEGRASLKDEMGTLRGGMLARLELEPCFVSRLAQVQDIIRRHDMGALLGVVGVVGRPLYPQTDTPLWDLAVADQSIAHMDLAEKRRFIQAYSWVRIFGVIIVDERTAWRSLQVLNHADVLTAAA